MRISSMFRQVMALVVGSVSVFVVTGCQGEDKPAPLPDLPATTASPKSPGSTKRPSASAAAAASAAPGARQPRFGESVPPSK